MMYHIAHREGAGMHILIIAVGVITVIWLVTMPISVRGNFFRKPVGAFVAGAA